MTNRWREASSELASQTLQSAPGLYYDVALSINGMIYNVLIWWAV